MANILINGYSSKTGGGKAIFENYLAVLTKYAPSTDDQYFIISCDPHLHSWANSNKARILDLPFLYSKRFFAPLFYLRVGAIVRSHRIDAIFNFGDIVLPVKIPQVYFFDWSYLVYPDSTIWKRMRWRDYLARRLKLNIIQATLRYATVVIAQTPTMVKRLEALYGLRNVVLIPSPVTLESVRGGAPRTFELPSGKKRLLCLANYAPHKNIDILLPLARLMKAGGCDFTIVTTLNASESAGVRRFLSQIDKESLGECIINIGRVEPVDVPALFRQCDALLLPTLLESYGLPFVEAMHNRTTVITSDFDFTRDVCGSAAFYFDPLNARSIYDSICRAFADEATRQEMIDLGVRAVGRLNDWTGAFMEYHNCINKALARQSENTIRQEELNS